MRCTTSVQRASRSSYVKEAADFAVALLDLNGEVFAYPPSATFAFLIDTEFKSTIDAVPDLAPGDVIITNDPYTSNGLSTHLPDLHLIAPYFVDGRDRRLWLVVRTLLRYRRQHSGQRLAGVDLDLPRRPAHTADEARAPWRVERRFHRHCCASTRAWRRW